MKFLFSILAVVLANSSAQRRQFKFSKSSVGFGGRPSSSSGGSSSDPAPPSYPPGFNGVSSAADGPSIGASIQNTESSASFFPSGNQKWVFCNNGWRQVTRR